MTWSDRDSCSASLNIFREKQEVYDVTEAFPAKSCHCPKPFESSHGGSVINTDALSHDEVFVKTFFLFSTRWLLNFEKTPRCPSVIYGSPGGPHSDFVSIFHFSVFIVYVSVFVFYFSVFVLNVLIFTSSFCILWPFWASAVGSPEIITPNHHWSK